MSNILIETSDKKHFTMESKHAMFLGCIRGVWGTFDTTQAIPLPYVHSIAFEKIMEWVSHHQDEDPQPIECTELRTDDVPKWDIEFLNASEDLLFDLLKAANYLDIPGLVTVTAKTIAKMIEGNTPDEIRAKFGVTH